MNNAQVHVERIKELKTQLYELQYKESYALSTGTKDIATVSNITYLIGEINKEILQEYHKLFNMTTVNRQ